MKILLLAILLLVSACGVGHFTANTEVRYKDFYYSSNKNQEGLDAGGELDDQGRIKSFRVKTNATTPEAAIMAAAAATAQLQTQIAELVKTLIPIIQQVASRGAIGGVPSIPTNSTEVPNVSKTTPKPAPGGGAITPNK